MRGLVVCFSIAVVLMASWLAITIMFSRLGTISAADDVDVITSAPVSEENVPPVSVENVRPEPEEPAMTTRPNSPYFEPLSRDYKSAMAAPSRAVLPATSLTEPSGGAIRDTTYPASSTAAPDADYRGAQVDEPLRAAVPVEPADSAADFVPLPPPKPARTASIPVPRPRPRLEGDDPQPAPEQSLFNLLMYGQR
jgi:hypothetical protein